MKTIFKIRGNYMNNIYNTVQRKLIDDYLSLSKDKFVNAEDI